MNTNLVYTSIKIAISIEWSFAHTLLFKFFGYYIYNPSYNKHMYIYLYIYSSSLGLKCPYLLVFETL